MIAYAAGGALDTQIDGVTGVLFPQPTVESLCAAVERADGIDFDPEGIRRHAQKFDTCAFEARITAILSDLLSEGCALVGATTPVAIKGAA